MKNRRIDVITILDDEYGEIEVHLKGSSKIKTPSWFSEVKTWVNPQVTSELISYIRGRSDHILRVTVNDREFEGDDAKEYMNEILESIEKKITISQLSDIPAKLRDKLLKLIS